MDHPFQRWVDLAHPRAQLWRTVLGAAIVLVVWVVWTLVVFLAAAALGLTSAEKFQAIFGGVPYPLAYADIVITLGAAMATFWGLWFGVWIAVRVIHRRGFHTVVAHDQRWRVREFLIGAGLAAAYLGVGAMANVLSGGAPERSTLPLDTWMLALLPLTVLIFFQSAGEEIFFRGYLTQQLAARTRLPLVWGLLPSLGFGIAHAANGGADMQFAAYYVVAATMLGLVMTATVWRTGGLSVAIGFHVMNNIGAILLVGVAGVSPPISLFVLQYDDMLAAAPLDLLILGMLLAFVLSPYAPLPKGQPLRRNVTRAAP